MAFQTPLILTWIIALDIQAAQSVKQALEQLVKPEELNGENAYHCGLCLQRAPASKTLTLHTSAKVLIPCIEEILRCHRQQTCQECALS